MQKKPTINVIGCGKLGKTIARLIVKNNLGTIKAICNAHIDSSQRAVEFIQQGSAYSRLADLPSADITFITVPDDHIEKVCIALADKNYFKEQQMVIHCSGALAANILDAAQQQGCYVASAHPLKSFANPTLSVETFAGTYCAIEGDKIACDFVNTLFSNLNAICFFVDPKNKMQYHAGAVMASNYLTTLVDASTQALINADIDKDIAFDICLSLMSGSLNNLAKVRSTKAALTGPIKRGDVDIIRKHLASFDDNSLKRLYKLLGKQTVELVAHNQVLADRFDKCFVD